LNLAQKVWLGARKDNGSHGYVLKSNTGLFLIYPFSGIGMSLKVPQFPGVKK